MKRKSIIQLLAIVVIALTTSCGNNDTPKGKDPKKPDIPELPELPKDPENPEKPVEYLYDMWLAIGEGTSSTELQDAHVVKKIPTLLEGEYDIRYKGAETLQSGITPFVIYHKGYYYSISRPKDGKNFGKYKITDDGVKTIKVFPMPELSDRRFAHEWLNDNTLVLIGAPDSKDKKTPKKHKMNWLKIDTESMEVIAKGTLDFPELGKIAKDEVFSSCGLLAYRKADNKLLFNFRHEDKKKPKMGLDNHNAFFTATINPDNMTVEHIYKETRVDRPGSVSFGSLRQQNGFFMPDGDYYMLCNTVRDDATSSTKQHGHILRIKAGEFRPDPNYKLDIFDENKIITIHHMRGTKVLAYLESPENKADENSWKVPRRFIWAVIDLTPGGDQHRIKDIPISQGGTYTELIVVEEDYAILGITDNSQTKFYKYEFATEKVTEVAKLKPGFFADRIIKLDR
ncbi:hypothetical protein [uncultured Porphyromonas sp.]|uniref:hypothetical protein n=1 Tax=uncultured Porphyromonas sp. TaxID=159274 RepID=UPI0026195697|nr:hypothetical protein [uncultured Porphyromonas sp.]